MKRLKLLFFGLFFVFGANMAQEYRYHPNDLDCLLKIMLSNTSDKYGVRMRETNAKLLLGESYTDDWHTDTDWLKHLNGNVTWINVENEEGVISQRIESIYFTGTNKLGKYLSGELNFSNCTSLVSVQSCDEKFTAVNLDGCEMLSTVFLDNNLIKRASFDNCYQINQIRLDGNQLMPSEMKLSHKPFEKFLFNNQKVTNYDYTIVYEHGELYLTIDLSAQIDNDFLMQHFVRNVIPDSNGVKSENEEGVIYYKVDDLLIFDFIIKVNIDYQSDDETKYGGNVVYEPAIFNSLEQIEIGIDGIPPKTANAFIYWVHDDDYIMIDSPKNSGSTFIKSRYLPAGEYIVLVDAEGYLCNYYSGTNKTNVRSWKDKSIKKVFPGDKIDIVLEKKQTLTDDGIEITGILEDASSIKASARVLHKSTVTLHKSSAKNEWIWVATTQTVEEDAYSFSNLPTGTYRVTVEMPGFDCSESIFILANTAGNAHENQNFIVDETKKIIKANGDIVSGYLSKEEIQLSVYPNPVTDILHIDGLEGACTVKIINMSGQVVQSVMGTSPELTLPLNDLSSGLYLLRIESLGKARTVKLIKN